jgi:TolB-like protein
VYIFQISIIRSSFKNKDLSINVFGKTACYNTARRSTTVHVSKLSPRILKLDDDDDEQRQLSSVNLPTDDIVVDLSRVRRVNAFKRHGENTMQQVSASTAVLAQELWL